LKIILSRKGFDDQNGQCASPIIGDELISMPIPTDESLVKLGSINYRNLNYLKVLNELRPKAGFKDTYCHVDPDIREGVNPLSQNWKAAFGQIGGDQRHLEAASPGNQFPVEPGDIFLFFGKYRNTKYTKDGQLRFVGPERHMVFGYMQIGKILRCSNKADIDEIKNSYKWHPHSDDAHLNDATNTLYTPTEQLHFLNEKTGEKTLVGMKGFGTLKYADKRVLTAPGLTKSKWIIHDWMFNVTISRHSSSNIIKEKGYFQSVNIGQEIVVSPNQNVTDWARNVITD